jgi:hypothetical protein
MIVESVAQPAQPRGDDGEIDDPAGLGIGLAGERNLDLDGMAVHAAVGVARRRRQQEMRGVKRSALTISALTGCRAACASAG